MSRCNVCKSMLLMFKHQLKIQVPYYRPCQQTALPLSCQPVGLYIHVYRGSKDISKLNLMGMQTPVGGPMALWEKPK